MGIVVTALSGFKGVLAYWQKSRFSCKDQLGLRLDYLNNSHDKTYGRDEINETTAQGEYTGMWMSGCPQGKQHCSRVVV